MLNFLPTAKAPGGSVADWLADAGPLAEEGPFAVGAVVFGSSSFGGLAQSV